MAITANYHTKFEVGRFYHIYNRSIDKKAMFKNDSNYEFFLKKYHQYLSTVVDTYAYCLLGNHFHLMIKVKETPAELLNTHDIVSNQFKKFFQSYAMAFNKDSNRTGTLFQTPFKRALIDSEEYYTQLIYYIHANPERLGLISDFRVWKWSSFSRMLLDKPTSLKKMEVLDWFGGKEGYDEFHNASRSLILSERHLLDNE